MPAVYDMHCHIDLMYDTLQLPKEIFNTEIEMLTMTTTPKAYEIESKKLSCIPNLNIAIGLHPQLVERHANEINQFEKLAQRSRFVGEIGLDYNKRYYHTKLKQNIIFERIISGLEESKIISIHSVYAEKDVLDILEKYQSPAKNICILHWYSGSKKQLERAAEMGCFFSVNNYMANSSNGCSLIETIPDDHVLVETDAPFISNIKNVKEQIENLEKCLVRLSEIKHCEMQGIVNFNSEKVIGKYSI